jgi:glutathionyl-hydroquinone reductase
MGKLVDGIWRDDWYNTEANNGRFVRKQSQFRNWITVDGSAGPSGQGGFAAEPGRYHLYVSHACPWAHRTMIFRTLKGLEKMIDVTVVEPLMLENGWELGNSSGPVEEARFLHQVYTAADPEYSGRVTVPVLWDKQLNTIVSNESAEIIRMFNSAFDGSGALAADFYPEHLRNEIDAVNDSIYNHINNGVYKAGFATTQQAYDEAFMNLFETLDEIETRLATKRYLLGDVLTEADWRLFTTLVRFDPVYVAHFKCNRNCIADFEHMSGYLRELYQVPGVAETVNMGHIKNHYYASHETINPTRIVPLGPDTDLSLPHGRGYLN